MINDEKLQLCNGDYKMKVQHHDVALKPSQLKCNMGVILKINIHFSTLHTI